DGVRLPRRGALLRLFLGDPVEAVAVVAEGALAVRVPVLPCLDLLGRAEAAVGVAGAEQLQRIAPVALDAGGLMERPLVPQQAEPLEPVGDRLDHRVARARAVGVLEAQDEGAAVVTGETPVEQCGSRAADVQVAGGRWRGPHADRSLAHGAGKLFRA